jgi:hypothetical protein
MAVPSGMNKDGWAFVVFWFKKMGTGFEFADYSTNSFLTVEKKFNDKFLKLYIYLYNSREEIFS